MNESEETEEIKKIPPLSLPATRIAGPAQQLAESQLDAPVTQDTTPLPHPTNHPHDECVYEVSLALKPWCLRNRAKCTDNTVDANANAMLESDPYALPAC